LRDHVSDHSFAFRAQNIKWDGILARCSLEGEQADLRPVPMGDDKLVVTGERCQRLDRFPDIPSLSFCRKRLTSLQ
jgi:hypothetical protein